MLSADQPAEDLPALDPCSDIDDVARLARRGLLLKALVRPVVVIVRGVLGQHLAEVLLAEDQHVVQALAPQRPHEPFGERGPRPAGRPSPRPVQVTARPPPLRHAAVSLWLNSGVPATEVARRAGHGVAVLLKI